MMKRPLQLCLSLCTLLALIITSHARDTLGTGTDTFELSWHTIDGGGGTSTADAYSLTGTIGQHDAGSMSGGEFTLTGGFWVAGDVQPQPPCTGDLNNDNVVDVSDLLTLLGEYGPCGSCPSDLNADTVVDVTDLLILLGAWGQCPE